MSVVQKTHFSLGRGSHVDLVDVRLQTKGAGASLTHDEIGTGIQIRIASRGDSPDSIKRLDGVLSTETRAIHVQVRARGTQRYIGQRHSKGAIACQPTTCIARNLKVGLQGETCAGGRSTRDGERRSVRKTHRASRLHSRSRGRFTRDVDTMGGDILVQTTDQDSSPRAIVVAVDRHSGSAHKFHSVHLHAPLPIRISTGDDKIARYLQ